MAIQHLLSLMRIKQWYKNLVIFFPLFFSQSLLNLDALKLTVIGFFCLCLISSSAYIINDIADIRKDKQHPEKCLRPLPSGTVSVSSAILLFIFLFLVSIFLGNAISGLFFWFLIALFLSMNLYTFIFKSIAIVDTIVIGIDFVIRAVSGVFLINAPMSSWLVLFVFLLAIFLNLSKRLYDLKVCGKNALAHKDVYRVYNEKLLEQLSTSMLILLLFSYILYTFLGHKTSLMMLTIPFVVYLVFRYLYFISINHPAIGKTERIFKDRGMVTGLILWGLSCFVVLYLI